MARFIAASKNTYNSNLAIRLNHILGYITPSFEGLWTKMLVRANALDDSIPTNLSSWIAKDATSIVDMFRSANMDVPKDMRHLLLASSYDFSTLYTTLPHDLICAAFDFLFDSVFEGHSYFAYNVNKAVDTGYFIDGPLDQGRRDDNHPLKGGWRYIKVDTLKSSLSFLIRNTYVLVGDKLFHQWLGIPMGTNPAVHIANYFLFYYELAFMNRLIDLQQTDILKSLLRTKRYIDDLCQLASADESAAFKDMIILEDFHLPGHPLVNCGIYPRLLVCNEEQAPAHRGHCLDIDYYYDHHNRRWYTDIYSKINDPKFSRLTWNRYPNIRTKLSTSCKYNVITAQTFRFFRLVSRKGAVILHLATLIHTLHIGRGYNLHRCFRYLYRAVSKFIPMWNIKSPRFMIYLVRKRFDRLVLTDKLARRDVGY